MTDLKLTLVYDDATNRTVTIADIDEPSSSTMKQKIFAFNDAIADSTSAAGIAYRDTFVSDDGAPVRSISKASYTTTEETVLYDG